jgi:hypothetical protein
MARNRVYGEDLTFAEWHRNRLPELYVRTGHRLDMANRDWTEFCHHCKATLAMWEEVTDRGQNLADKATTVTRGLAERANVHALLVAPRIDRPRDVQRTIDMLNTEIRRLEALHPISRFTVRRLFPEMGPFVTLTPDEFAAEIHLLHRSHHEWCTPARRSAPVTRAQALEDARVSSRVWAAIQPRLMEQTA